MNFIWQYILYFFPHCYITQLRIINKFYASIYKPKKIFIGEFNVNYRLDRQYFSGKKNNDTISIIKSVIGRKRNKLIKKLSKEINLRTVIFECALAKHELKIAQYMVTNFRQTIDFDFISNYSGLSAIESIKFLFDNNIPVHVNTICFSLMNKNYDVVLYFAKKTNNFDIFYDRPFYASNIRTIKFFHMNNFHMNWQIVARNCVISNYIEGLEYIFQNFGSEIDVEDLLDIVDSSIDGKIIKFLNDNRYFSLGKVLLSNGCTIN